MIYYYKDLEIFKRQCREESDMRSPQSQIFRKTESSGINEEE